MARRSTFQRQGATPPVVDSPDLLADLDPLPSLKRALAVLPKLRRWASEFDALDAERYSAVQFVEWLELELAPPAKPKGDQGGPVYSVVGAAALVFGG